VRTDVLHGLPALGLDLSSRVTLDPLSIRRHTLFVLVHHALSTFFGLGQQRLGFFGSGSPASIRIP
jgi:hypothetical protein